MTESGKSALLGCLGDIPMPTRGRMRLGAQVTFDQGWNIKDLAALRRDRIGLG